MARLEERVGGCGFVPCTTRWPFSIRAAAGVIFMASMDRSTSSEMCSTPTVWPVSPTCSTTKTVLLKLITNITNVIHTICCCFKRKPHYWAFSKMKDESSSGECWVVPWVRRQPWGNRNQNQRRGRRCQASGNRRGETDRTNAAKF